MGAHLLMNGKQNFETYLKFVYFQFRFYLLLKNVCVYQRPPETVRRASTITLIPT